MRIASLLAIIALSSAHPARAQLPVPKAEPIVAPRMPALSPDGKRLVFVYRGDLWIAAVRGGQARPLTQHVASDAYPVFSPDGNWVAFSSKREGGWDIHLVPARGGEARRLTWSSGSDFPGGFSPDGTRLLFGGKRDSGNYGIYSLDLQSLELSRLAEDYAALNWPRYSPDGATVVYGRYGFPWNRPRYHGSAAMQVYTLATGTGERKPLSSTGQQQLWPQFLPDGKAMVAVTVGQPTPNSPKLDTPLPALKDSPARTPNLWRFDADGTRTRLTSFKGGAVLWPSVAAQSGDIAFEQGNDLWLLRATEAKPRKLRLFAEADEKETRHRRELLTGGVTEAELSPDGKQIALGLKGDIWVVPVDRPKGLEGRDKEFAKRLTDWAGDDSDFVWSGDGKRLYFTSDREGNARIYEVEVGSLKLRPLWPRHEDVVQIRLTPDEKQLAFWAAGPEGGLNLLELKTGNVRRIVRLPGTHWLGSGGGAFAFSPDMQWVAYQARSASRSWNLFIAPVKGGEPVNVTQLNAHHSLPVWSPDGTHLFFASNRDGNGLYVLPLVKEDAHEDNTMHKFEKPKGAVKVAIDFDRIHQRIRKHSSRQPDADLMITPDGTITFLSGGDLWTVSYDGKESKQLTTDRNKAGYRLTPDAKKGVFQSGGQAHTFAFGANPRPAKLDFKADWERDIDAERLAAFAQFWRSFAHNFYDPGMHGRDWAAIRQRHEPALAGVATKDEFAALLNRMVGELEGSHSEVNAASDEPAEVNTAHPGFEIDYRHRGPGVRVADVPNGAPGSFDQTRIRPGDYVFEINGEPVTASEKLFELLNRLSGRELNFLVNGNPSRQDARRVSYQALTRKEWDDLLYRNRTESARAEVERLSRGQIGYLHIPAMGANDSVQFEREAYEYIAGKAGMIIDVRFNRGGNISDSLIDRLERRQHGWYRPRDADPEPAPGTAWEKPVVVLMNEHSYSNAEMFAYATRQRGLARLVGTPTPGYVIWTSGLGLVDGTRARMPQSGVFRLDGSNMENQGEQPDYRVALSPEDWISGRDPQLARAIELLTHSKPAAPGAAGGVAGGSKRK